VSLELGTVVDVLPPDVLTVTDVDTVLTALGAVGAAVDTLAAAAAGDGTPVADAATPPVAVPGPAPQAVVARAAMRTTMAAVSDVCDGTGPTSKIVACGPCAGYGTRYSPRTRKVWEPAGPMKGSKLERS